MKINKRIRIKVYKRCIKKLSKQLDDCNPYGYQDCQKIYDDLMYFEDKLHDIKQKHFR